MKNFGSATGGYDQGVADEPRLIMNAHVLSARLRLGFLWLTSAERTPAVCRMTGFPRLVGPSLGTNAHTFLF